MDDTTQSGRHGRPAHPLEQAVGMGVYATDVPGTGGRLRDQPADFQVHELETIDPEPQDADPDAYPHLLIRAKLTDWDTNDFASRLADALEASRERVGWAGTKDRRAVTTQWFTINGATPDDLPDIRGADISVVGRLGRSLRFGDLAGNRFEITARDIAEPAHASAVTERLQALGGEPPGLGIPNFFGHQRFGSRRPITHIVGRRLLAGDFEGAVMAYVGNPSEYEPPVSARARQFAEETRDWGEALERFPRALGYERALLSALDGGASFRSALEALPQNLRRLFVHAAQSDIFNRVLSRRYRQGLPLATPIAGDVVCFTKEHDDVIVPDTDRTQRVDADRLDVVRRHCQRGRAFVTAPLVGTETTFGDGRPDEIVREVLDEIGIERADFELPEPYRSAGTRRSVLVRTDATVETTAETLRAEFALPKGAYATTVLREYLKVDPRSL